MGYNTIAFVLNDFSGDINRSPHTVVSILTNPAFSNEGIEQARAEARRVARAKGEPLPEQAIITLPTFHSSLKQFYVAGGNTINQLEAVRFGKDPKTGRRTVTLLLPEWW